MMATANRVRRVTSTPPFAYPADVMCLSYLPAAERVESAPAARCERAVGGARSPPRPSVRLLKADGLPARLAASGS